METLVCNFTILDLPENLNCVKVLDQYEFGCIKLHAIAVTPDSTRLLGVGTLLQSPTGLQPSKARPEKRLIGMWTRIHASSLKLIIGIECTTWEPIRLRSNSNCFIPRIRPNI